jgi:hypothetical protein
MGRSIAEVNWRPRQSGWCQVSASPSCPTRARLTMPCKASAISASDESESAGLDRPVGFASASADFYRAREGASREARLPAAAGLSPGR